MGFWKSVLSVGSWPTEARGLACSSGKPAMQLLVVPGNPGYCGFYDEFMLQLARAFGGHDIDIMAVSHAGHDSAGLSQGKVRQCAQQLLEEPGGQRAARAVRCPPSWEGCSSMLIDQVLRWFIIAASHTARVC
eukprot:GHRQ01020781.1.p1 GENE.GHRQ01020781.1~~GHRQ01020781.1.p1  ORF type:complete len:133 (+),score=16.35 GHRQ01020781.1:139-537(+)